MIRLRSFLQKSLNMVKTPELKFLDTSTCELFQLGSGRDGRERELLISPAFVEPSSARSGQKKRTKRGQPPSTAL